MQFLFFFLNDLLLYIFCRRTKDVHFGEMIKALFFGRVPYLTGLHIQDCLYQRLLEEHPYGLNRHFLCLFEHPPAYTVGIRQGQYSDEEARRLRTLGAEFHRVKRGGLITFHGPGQLVAYPIFNLHSLGGGGTLFGVRRFVELVEKSLLRMLESDFQLKGVQKTADPGVWVDGTRKVAAVGIQVRHGITSHGLALNCDTDLGWFAHIVPCGLHGKSATSISKELGRHVSVSDAIRPFCARFSEHFGVPVELAEGHCAEQFVTKSFGDSAKKKWEPIF